MTTADTCRREIEALHECFVDWFTGKTGADSFERVERALAPEFEMVTPQGVRRGYDDVVDGVRTSHGIHEPGTFDIEIRSVEVRTSGSDHALVRYEEYQETPDGQTGRLSTVLFEADADAPGDVVWVDLHETWLDGHGPVES